jgi:hypothetical protein
MHFSSRPSTVSCCQKTPDATANLAKFKTRLDRFFTQHEWSSPASFSQMQIPGMILPLVAALSTSLLVLSRLWPRPPVVSLPQPDGAVGLAGIPAVELVTFGPGVTVDNKYEHKLTNQEAGTWCLLIPSWFLNHETSKFVSYIKIWVSRQNKKLTLVNW